MQWWVGESECSLWKIKTNKQTKEKKKRVFFSSTDAVLLFVSGSWSDALIFVVGAERCLGGPYGRFFLFSIVFILFIYFCWPYESTREGKGDEEKHKYFLFFIFYFFCRLVNGMPVGVSWPGSFLFDRRPRNANPTALFNLRRDHFGTASINAWNDADKIALSPSSCIPPLPALWQLIKALTAQSAVSSCLHQVVHHTSLLHGFKKKKKKILSAAWSGIYRSNFWEV